jgi:hypothetical protein
MVMPATLRKNRTRWPLAEISTPFGYVGAVEEQRIKPRLAFD